MDSVAVVPRPAAAVASFLAVLIVPLEELSSLVVKIFCSWCPARIVLGDVVLGARPLLLLLVVDSSCCIDEQQAVGDPDRNGGGRAPPGTVVVLLGATVDRKEESPPKDRLS